MYRLLIALVLCIALAAFATLGTESQAQSKGKTPSKAKRTPIKVDPKNDPWTLGPTGLQVVVKSSQLEVVTVASGSPASGKIMVGDMIYGAGENNFASSTYRSFLRSLAKAQEKGEEGGKLEVRFKRGEKEHKVTLEIDQIGSGSSFGSSKSVKAAAMLEALLDYLVKKQVRGAWRAQLSWTNGVATTVAFAGLAMLNQGDDKYRQPIKDAAEWVIKNVTGSRITTEEERKGQPNWNQDNWAWSFSGLFLAEYWRVSKDKKAFEKLGKIAEAILKNQEPSGGWGHGPGGPNALKYLEFVQMTLQCLAALQSIQACGVKVPKEPILSAKAYVLATQDKKGGIGYSATKTGAKGYSQVGRTSFASIVFADDQANLAAFKKMRRYSHDNRNKAREGHASALMHIVWQSLASARFSSSSHSKFFDSNRWLFEASHHADGGGIAQPNKETRKVGQNFDRTNGRAWATAALALALSARHKGLWLQGAEVTTWKERDQAAQEEADKEATKKE